jgi:hypothetical protein
MELELESNHDMDQTKHEQVVKGCITGDNA